MGLLDQEVFVAMDTAPDVSDDYSFLLESSVLDRNDSISPSTPQCDVYPRFAVSRVSQVCCGYA